MSKKIMGVVTGVNDADEVATVKLENCEPSVLALYTSPVFSKKPEVGDLVAWDVGDESVWHAPAGINRCKKPCA